MLDLYDPLSYDPACLPREQLQLSLSLLKVMWDSTRDPRTLLACQVLECRSCTMVLYGTSTSSVLLRYVWWSSEVELVLVLIKCVI